MKLLPLLKSCKGVEKQVDKLLSRTFALIFNPKPAVQTEAIECFAKVYLRKQEEVRLAK